MQMRFGFRGASRAHARQVLLFGSALFGIQSAAVVKLQSDEIVIGAALPVSNISPYAIARRLSTLPGQLTSQFVLVLLPIASRLHAEGEAGLLRQIYLTGLRLTLALFAIVGGALILLEVMDALGHDHLVYSEDDILDGLVASLRTASRQTV